MENTKIYKKALNKFGEKAQLVKALEELSELSVEIAKLANNPDRDLKGLVDEIADVRIILEQIEYNYKIDAVVQFRLIEKIEKLKGYL